MAFNKKTWKDRLSEFATRRILTDQDTGNVSVVEVARSEGTIYQQGDAFSAENMNDLEDRIANEFTQINSDLTELMSLLWTNSDTSTSQTFAAQTISLDLSGYDFIMVTHLPEIASSNAFLTNRVGATDQMQIAYPGSQSAYGTVSMYRAIDITSEGVHFADCRRGYTGSSSTVSNNNCIPYKIYGIKLPV